MYEQFADEVYVAEIMADADLNEEQWVMMAFGVQQAESIEAAEGSIKSELYSTINPDVHGQSDTYDYLGLAGSSSSMRSVSLPLKIKRSSRQFLVRGTG